MRRLENPSFLSLNLELIPLGTQGVREETTFPFNTELSRLSIKGTGFFFFFLSIFRLCDFDFYASQKIEKFENVLTGPSAQIYEYFYLIKWAWLKVAFVFFFF